MLWLQVLMGAAAARLVMVEGVDDEGKPVTTQPAPAGSVLLPILGLVGITVARAAGLAGPGVQHYLHRVLGRAWCATLHSIGNISCLVHACM